MMGFELADAFVPIAGFPYTTTKSAKAKWQRLFGRCQMY